MRLLGVSSRDKKKFKEPTLVDFLQFVDAVVEVHGDPFFELRYRCATVCPLHVRQLSLLSSLQLPVPLDRRGRQ